MPIIYICKKCSKDYSREEYAQSRLCLTCGSFLLPTFKTEGQRLTTQSSGTNSSKEKLALLRAAESLRQKIGRTKEYEVIPEIEKEQPKAPTLKAGYGAPSMMKP